MTSEHQHQSLHFFHSYAALDRVNCSSLPCDAPSGDVKGLEPSAFLPTAEDCSVIHQNYSILLGRVLVDQLPFFHKFKDCVEAHILHEHSAEMKEKSTVVS